MGDADKYLQVCVVSLGLPYYVCKHTTMICIIIFYIFYNNTQSWLGWEYKPYVPKTVSFYKSNKCILHVCTTVAKITYGTLLQGSGSSIWFNNGTMNMQVVDVRATSLLD